ncbi:hypothetical protein E2C01_080278 [Portunus trituberculatus]|uniref:Uncharacterized protein n=1 Tax=Portunus trituberculatus TaxID=210409 RepID=A0A5B7ITN5_PORTR|nr:hypothetical protein [Portunus trituberculatus]
MTCGCGDVERRGGGGCGGRGDHRGKMRLSSLVIRWCAALVGTGQAVSRHRTQEKRGVMVHGV